MGLGVFLAAATPALGGGAPATGPPGDPSPAQAPSTPIRLAQVEGPSGPPRVGQPAPVAQQPGPASPGPPSPATAPAAGPAHGWLKPEIDLSQIETKDLSLLYFDPAETYLTPYLARSFLNFLAFQPKVFGWKPW